MSKKGKTIASVDAERQRTEVIEGRGEEDSRRGDFTGGGG